MCSFLFKATSKALYLLTVIFSQQFSTIIKFVDVLNFIFIWREFSFHVFAVDAKMQLKCKALLFDILHYKFR